MYVKGVGGEMVWTCHADLRLNDPNLKLEGVGKAASTWEV